MINPKFKKVTYWSMAGVLTVVYLIYISAFQYLDMKATPVPTPPPPAPVPLPGVEPLIVNSEPGMGFMYLVGYPITLYFGKKSVDIFFWLLEKKLAKSVDTSK